MTDINSRIYDDLAETWRDVKEFLHLFSSPEELSSALRENGFVVEDMQGEK